MQFCILGGQNLHTDSRGTDREQETERQSIKQLDRQQAGRQAGSWPDRYLYNSVRDKVNKEHGDCLVVT